MLTLCTSVFQTVFTLGVSLMLPYVVRTRLCLPLLLAIGLAFASLHFL